METQRQARARGHGLKSKTLMAFTVSPNDFRQLLQVAFSLDFCIIYKLISVLSLRQPGLAEGLSQSLRDLFLSETPPFPKGLPPSLSGALDVYIWDVPQFLPSKEFRILHVQEMWSLGLFRARESLLPFYCFPRVCCPLIASTPRNQETWSYVQKEQEGHLPCTCPLS